MPRRDLFPLLPGFLALLLCAAAAAASPAPPAANPVDLRGYFPDAGSVAPKAEVEEYQEYGRDRLYEYINGGAEVYLDLDFIKVGARDYVIPLEEETYITLDVYDMARPVNAFGIYSAEDHGDLPAVDVGVEGNIGGGALTFWTQRYYVKLRADDDSDAVNRILKKMAGHVSSRIGEPGRIPPEIDLFPARDRVAASERYAARNLMGIGPLSGFSTRFRKGDQEITLHLSHFTSAAEAAKAEKALARRGVKPPPGAAPGKENAYASRYLGEGRLLRIDGYIAIAQGVKKADGAGTWAAGLADEFFKAVGAAAK